MQVVACLALATVMAGSGCSIQKMALRETGKIMLFGSKAINEEPDFEMARLGMPASLKSVEVMLASLPDDPNMLFLLAQGYGAYAFLVIEDEMDLADAAGDLERVKVLKARADGLYQRSQGFASRILGAALTNAIENGALDALPGALAKLQKKDVPALFWYAYAWLGRINLNQTNMALVSGLPRVDALLARCVALDPEYYYGLPLLTTGAFYTARAPMFGGDLPRGKAALEKGIAVTQGRFLAGKFLLARFYAVQAQDRDLFCSTLQEIANAPSNLLPAQQLMNNVAVRWAVRWRARAGSLFEAGGCVEPAPVQGKKVEDDDDALN